jgi:hypothetical protein
MDKLFRKKIVLALLAIVMPFISFSQEENRDIDPPPTPIDESIIFLFIAAIVLAAFYFYKINFKTEIK